MKLLLRFCALLALMVSPLLGNIPGYNPNIVGSDARWVVFANFDALRASTLGKELITAVETAQSQATGGVIGINIHKVLKTVGTITAYGTNLQSNPQLLDGALIAQGTADLRKITESILLQGTLGEPEVFSEITDLPFPAYAISDPKDKSANRTQLVIAFPPEPMVIVSKSRAQLLKAREVFRGSAPSLGKGGPSALTQVATKSPGAFLFAASMVPTEPLFPQNAPQARILQLATSAAIALGEQESQTFAHAELLATSDQNAEKLMKILQGLTSMLSLAESNDQQLGEFLHATDVTRNKEAVTLRLSYSSERLLKMTQTLRQQAAARVENRQPPIVHGKPLLEWQASDPALAVDGTRSDGLVSRTIESVQLLNGSTVSVGRFLNGGRNAKFDRVEVAPADGSGTPLVFKSEFMRNFRGTMSQFQFPGADGAYTLKVWFVNDPEGKAKFAVSVRNPGEGQPPTAPKGR